MVYPVASLVFFPDHSTLPWRNLPNVMKTKVCCSSTSAVFGFGCDVTWSTSSLATWWTSMTPFSWRGILGWTWNQNVVILFQRIMSGYFEFEICTIEYSIHYSILTPQIPSHFCIGGWLAPTRYLLILVLQRQNPSHFCVGGWLAPAKYWLMFVIGFPQLTSQFGIWGWLAPNPHKLNHNL